MSDATPAAVRAFIELLVHDLRTPLAAVIGYHELIEEGVYGEVPEALKEPLQRIAHAAHHLELILAGVGELGRPLGDAPSLEHAPIELDPLLAEALRAGRQLAHERGIKLDLDVPPALGTIHGDAERIGSLLGLALAAAIRSSPRGELRVSAALAADRFTLEIAGTDIPADTPVPLGVAEFAGGGRDAQRGSLRLAIVRRLAHHLGGELTLLPETPGRSTIRVFVPHRGAARAG